MPTKRKRIMRTWEAPVSDARVAYLESGTYPEGEADLWDVLTFDRGNAIREAWAAVRDRVLADWIADDPGTRPWAWWLFDAPAWAGPIPSAWQGAYFVPALREPRRRLGGRGTANHDALRYVPTFRFGLPASGWVTDFDVAYYRGRAVDVHGKPIATEFRGRAFPFEALDPNDPPTFESEAAYLDRHGLMTPAERRRVPAVAFEPVRIVVTEDSSDA